MTIVEGMCLTFTQGSASWLRICHHPCSSTSSDNSNCCHSEFNLVQERKLNNSKFFLLKLEVVKHTQQVPQLDISSAKKSTVYPYYKGESA